ncbi:MAG: putative ABC transporter permease [Oscillospiraceae bacterium]|nr:putative ABC transporter permease [Oscillospiraceae bacterium]
MRIFLNGKTPRRLRCEAGLFLIGGAVYNLIELLWRGRTHWSMFVLGGCCFHLIGLASRIGRRWPAAARCSLCSLMISAAEFGGGCLVNLSWKMDVWDYSGLPFNLLGQVCLLYSVLWALLSIPAMPFYRVCRRALSSGEMRVESLFCGKR